MNRRGSAFGDFDVRIEPWQVEYGSELPASSDEELPAEDVALDVELTFAEWRAIVPGPSAIPPRLVFVDGVRRVDARLLAVRGGSLCHGAFGGYAVGRVVVEDGVAEVGEERVARVVVLGSGERLPSRIEVDPSLTYEPLSTADPDADAPLAAIQNEMRLCEEQLARRLADQEDTLVIADGPLTFEDPVRGGAIGFIKRRFRLYIPGSTIGLISSLPVGGRTPLFAIRSTRRFARYSWFVRLASPMAADSQLSGTVRLEISEAVGKATACKLADATTQALPAFAPGRARDPRAPQNLLPIGALESRLRRLLGDPRLVRRRIESLVAHEVVAI